MFRDGRYSKGHAGETPPTLARGRGGEGREEGDRYVKCGACWTTDKCPGGGSQAGREGESPAEELRPELRLGQESERTMSRGRKVPAGTECGLGVTRAGKRCPRRGWQRAGGRTRSHDGHRKGRGLQRRRDVLWARTERPWLLWGRGRLEGH